MKLLAAFRDDCRLWYEHRARPHCDARQLVYATLILRHGPDAVKRWQHRIKAVLDGTENETREEIQ